MILARFARFANEQKIFLRFRYASNLQKKMKKRLTPECREGGSALREQPALRIQLIRGPENSSSRLPDRLYEIRRRQHLRPSAPAQNPALDFDQAGESQA